MRINKGMGGVAFGTPPPKDSAKFHEKYHKTTKKPPLPKKGGQGPLLYYTTLAAITSN